MRAASPTSGYHAPVYRLLTLGEPKIGYKWPDYLHMGFTPAHVPELLRMALDRAFGDMPEPEVWAPVYAWRVLGQLRAEEAVEPLLDRFVAEAGKDYVEQDEWALMDIPEAAARIGPPALPALVGMLEDRVLHEDIRNAIPHSLWRMVEYHPGTREQVVAALVEVLEEPGDEDPTLVGFVVSALASLRAVQAAPAIEAMFAAGRVDLSIIGDWEDAQVALGLLAERRAPRSRGVVEAIKGPRPGGRRSAGRQAKKRPKQSRRRKRGK